MNNTREIWSVGEYYSSSRPKEKVLVVSVGETEIRMDQAHHSFIRTVADWTDKIHEQKLIAALNNMVELFGKNFNTADQEGRDRALEYARQLLATVKP